MQSLTTYTILPLFKNLMPVIIPIWDFSKIYLFWSVTHWASIELYRTWCTPNIEMKWNTWKWNSISFEKLFQFTTSPLYIESPHCKILNWSYQTSVSTLKHFSSTIITWLLGIATGTFKGKYSKT